MVARFAFGLIAGLLVLAQPAAAQFLITPQERNNPCFTKAPKEGLAEPPRRCAESIAAAKDNRTQAILYFSWGYSLVEVENNLAALPWLDKAIELAPDFGNARQERGYARNALGYYELAIEDLNVAIRMFPDKAHFYQERAYAYHHLARFGEELADREAAIKVDGPSPNNSVGRANTLMWLARYAEAEKELAQWKAGMLSEYGQSLLNEIRARRKYRPKGDAAKLCDIEGIDSHAKAIEVYDACTWAFDHEKNPAKRADYISLRSVAATIAEGSPESGIGDAEMAVRFDPKNPDRHANYGSLLLASNQSWPARNAFNLALSLPGIRPSTKAMALGGRAQASFNLGEEDAAKSDAEAAMAIEPSPMAMNVLAQLAFDAGDNATARKHWLDMWRYGMRSDDLRDNLRKVGVDDPDKAIAG